MQRLLLFKHICDGHRLLDYITHKGRYIHRVPYHQDTFFISCIILNRIQSTLYQGVSQSVN
jgi:hypothetical protein